MSKTKRISVPIPTGLERHLRRIAAKDGCSIAYAFTQIAEAGLRQSDLQQELSEIKKAVRQHPPAEKMESETLLEMRRAFDDLRTEMKDGAHARVGVLLPEKAALLICGEALFSSALASEILNAELPGTPPKPAAHHIRNARQKSSAALKNFLSACGW